MFCHLPGFDKLNKQMEGKYNVKLKKLTIIQETGDIWPIAGTKVVMEILMNEDMIFVGDLPIFLHSFFDIN